MLDKVARKYKALNNTKLCMYFIYNEKKRIYCVLAEISLKVLFPASSSFCYLQNNTSLQGKTDCFNIIMLKENEESILKALQSMIKGLVLELMLKDGACTIQ